MPHQFVAYFRVSTQKQGHSGLGIEAQKAAVEQYVRSVGGTLLAGLTEVESGKVRERPVLRQALDQCRQAKATLIVAKLDRLSRSVAFISSIMEAKVDFIAVDMPHANKFLVHVMAAFAEHEREIISTRTKAALAAAKQRGVRLGTYGATLAAQQKEQAKAFAEQLRPVIVEVLETGPRTLAEIAQSLAERGIQTRENGVWTPMTVSRVLTRLDLKEARRGEAPTRGRLVRCPDQVLIADCETL